MRVGSLGRRRICVLSVQPTVSLDRPKSNISWPRHGTSTDCTESNLDAGDEQSLVSRPGHHDKTSLLGVKLSDDRTRKRERPSSGTSQASGPGEGEEGAKRQSPSLDSKITETASFRASCRSCAVSFLGTCRRCPGCGGIPDEFRIVVFTTQRVTIGVHSVQDLVSGSAAHVPDGVRTGIFLRLQRSGLPLSVLDASGAF